MELFLWIVVGIFTVVSPATGQGMWPKKVEVFPSQNFG